MCPTERCPSPAPRALLVRPSGGPIGQVEIAVVSPSFIRCVGVMLWVKVLLSCVGFLGTIAWLRRATCGIPLRAPVSLHEVGEVERLVARVGALFPGRALCLEQSLVLYYLLRKQGVAAEYCHGVQPYPLLAHAWIELEGKVINDIPERTRLFAKLPINLP